MARAEGDGREASEAVCLVYLVHRTKQTRETK
jgi:hypothetical protein